MSGSWADRLLGERKGSADVCRELQISEQTYYRWRIQFGGLEVDDGKRLKELEKESSTLKRLLADAELGYAALKDAALRVWLRGYAKAHRRLGLPPRKVDRITTTRQATPEVLRYDNGPDTHR